MKRFEVVIVPDNPMMPSTYPPRLVVEAEGEEQVRAWFKEAKEQGGQYAGCHILLVGVLA